jgi:hypothetical protein
VLSLAVHLLRYFPIAHFASPHLSFAHHNNFHKISAFRCAVEVDNTASPSSINSDENVTSPSPAMNNNQATTQQCEACTKTTVLLCPRCMNGLDATGKERKVYYCDTACQSEDWAARHKLECKVAIDRRQLSRISPLAQLAFYRSSKAVWYDGVNRVKTIARPETDDDPRLLVWYDERQDGVDFPAFPDDLIEEDRDEQALLASSTSAVTIMSSFLRDLGEGEFSLSLILDYH